MLKLYRIHFLLDRYTHISIDTDINTVTDTDIKRMLKFKIISILKK
jgi:hypothetical protein